MSVIALVVVPAPMFAQGAGKGLPDWFFDRETGIPYWRVLPGLDPPPLPYCVMEVQLIAPTGLTGLCWRPIRPEETISWGMPFPWLIPVIQPGPSWRSFWPACGDIDVDYVLAPVNCEGSMLPPRGPVPNSRTLLRPYYAADLAGEMPTRCPESLGLSNMSIGEQILGKSGNSPWQTFTIIFN
jgi:hypothetical protein